MREAAETLRHDEATAAAVKRLDSYLELRALLEFTANQADERIPLRVGSEVGHDRPHTLRRCIELNLAAELSHLLRVFHSRWAYPWLDTVSAMARSVALASS